MRRFRLDATRDPVAVLKRLRSLIKDGGLLLVQLGSVFNAPLVIQRPMELFIETQNSATDYHPYYFTRKSLKACLERVGFEILEEPRRYSTANYFAAKPGMAKALEQIDLQSWRSLYLFFCLWRLRDWILINAVTRPVYRRLDLPTWKRRIKDWLPK